MTPGPVVQLHLERGQTFERLECVAIVVGPCANTVAFIADGYPVIIHGVQYHRK